MPPNQSDKPPKKKIPKCLKGRGRDIFILVCGFVLGGAFDLLINQHGRTIGNYLYSICCYRIHNQCCLFQLAKQHLWEYIQVSLPGIVIELFAILVVLIIIFIFYRRDDSKEDEIIAILKQIRDKDIANPSDGGTNHAETTAKRQGETTIKKKASSKTKEKESEKGGRT